MAYSSLPFPGNTSLENLRVIAADTTIYIAPPNNGLGKTGSAGTWTGLTWGNDSTGDGTLAKPYATLKRAWQAAQDYIITGESTLTIQFQKGIYGYTYTVSDPTTNPFPENLYHPQGERIVIQGDPNGIKQRYLYRVSGYGWDMSRWSYYGHTGTVNLWRAQHFGGDTAASYPAGSGNTAHGFTFEDELGFACITNAAMGAENGYKDSLNGVGSGAGYGKYYIAESYGHNWGRAHFNHGLSYEEACGVWGICRIENARSNPYDLRVQFKNTNIDGRVFAYPDHTPGVLRSGLGTGLSYGGIDANYPEPQYSQPNGYYGPTAGIAKNGTSVTPAWETVSTTVFGNNGASVNLTYPARAGGDVHITDDPHLFTSYPVVIKVYSSGNNTVQNKPVPFVLNSAKVGSIRNLMLVNGDLDATSRDAIRTGVTLGTANGLDSVLGINTGNFTHYSQECLTLRNGSETKIRHLGMMGWGTDGYSLVIHDRSKVYLDPCIAKNEYTVASYESSEGSATAFAELGRLNNTPSLMCTHGGGIDISEGSVLDLSASISNKTAALPKQRVYGDSTMWVQNTYGGSLIAKGSGTNVVLGSSHFVNMTALPGLYTLSMNFPVLPGITVYNGSSAGFYHPTVFATGRGNTYHVIGYKTTSTGRTPFMRVCRMIGGATSSSGNWWGNNVTWSGGLTPVFDQVVSYTGTKIFNHSMDTDRAVRSFIDAGTGNTLEFFAYHDGAEGVTVPNQYLGIGKNAVVVRTPGGGGVTYTGATTGNGVTSAFHDLLNTRNRQSCVDMYEYNSNYNGIASFHGANIEIQGNTTLSGKSYVGIYSAYGSTVRILPTANVTIQNCTHSGVLVEWNSIVDYVGSNETLIIVKHPVAFGIGNNGADGYSNYGYGMYARGGGRLSLWGSAVCVGMPLTGHGIVNEASQYNGFFSTLTAASASVDGALGAANPDNMPLRFTTGANVSLPTAYQQIIGCWDGGTVREPTAANGIVAHSTDLAKVHGIGAIHHLWNTAQGVGSNTPRIMTRGSWGSGSVQQWLYNSPRGSTMWFANATGWMSSTSATSTTVNTLYKEKIAYGSGVANPTITTPQRTAAYDANPPGYSGPAFKIVNTGGHDDLLIFGG